MGQLMDRYALEIVPTKATKSQESNRLSLRRLRPVFGHMHPAKVLPRHYNQYKHTAAGKFGKTSINRDLEVLSHLLTMAVEWGVIDKNPLIGQVKKHRTRPRDRLVEDWEIAEVLGLEIPKDKRTARTVNLAKLYVRFKLMTGLRRSDILRLRVPELRDDGIHVQPHKTKDSTGIRLIIEWDPAGELRELVEEILRLPPRRVGDVPLFVTREGMPYIKESGSANAFDSLWQRFMDRVMKETKVKDRFQERDLRAKVASDSDTLQEASQRLGHADSAITQRVYRRKPVRVQPLIKGKST
jgi:integrase